MTDKKAYGQTNGLTHLQAKKGNLANLKENIQFTKLEKFLDSMQEDEYGNLTVTIDVSGTLHTISLNSSHRPVRVRRGAAPADKLAELKEEAVSLKDEIVANLIDNVKDQTQTGTVLEFTSAFDLHMKHTLEKRLEYIEELGKLYCQSYVHTIDENDEFWGKYKISIRYPAKIDCTVEDLVSEFRSLWPIINKSWKPFMKDKINGNRNFWNMMSSQYTITHPNLFQLLDIVFSMAVTTGPLERSYSKLAKICYKDRNKLSPENIEVQYLVSLLKNYPFSYPDVIAWLEQ